MQQKRIKPERESENKSVQICPKCGSPGIKTDLSNVGAITRGFFITKCNNCQHEGTFFPSIPRNKLKKPKDLKDVRNITHFDVTFSKGFSGIFFFINSIFFTAAGLLMLFYSVLYGKNSILSIILIVLGLIFYYVYVESKKLF